MADGSHKFEKFACAPGLRLEAHERLSEVHNTQIREQLGRLESTMHRLERRLWLAVFGVVSTVLGQAVLQLLP